MLSPSDTTCYRDETDTFQGPQAEGTLTTDVLIIGGGITGLSTAYHLVKSGAKVILLEAETLGAQASGRAGGFLTVYAEKDFAAMSPSEASTHLAMTQSGIDGIFAAVRDHDLRCSLESDKSILYFGYRPIHLFRLHRELEARRLLGFHEDHLLSKEQLPDLIGSDTFHSGLLTVGGHHAVNPFALVQELGRTVKLLGGDIFIGSPLLSFNHNTLTAHTPLASIKYGSIVFCSGAGAIAFPQLASPRSRMITVVSEILATRELDKDAFLTSCPKGGSVMFADVKNCFNYCRCTAKKRIIFGGGGSLIGHSEAITGTAHSFAARRTRLTRQFHAFFPDLSEAVLSHSWEGVIPITADFQPLVGEIEPRCFVALFPAGMQFGFQCGAWIRQILSGENVQPEQWEMIRWDRKQAVVDRAKPLMAANGLLRSAINLTHRIVDRFTTGVY